MTAVRRSTLIAAVLAVLLALFAPFGPAAAAPQDPATDPFFAAPANLADLAPGTVIRTRPVATKLFPGVPLGTSSFQILVRSNDAKDRPAAVAATVIVPRNPTKRLLAYQPAIDSLGAKCNPSYTLQVGSEKEAALIAQGLNKGLTVVVPDHQGPRHAFAAGPMAAHAVLDSIRGALVSPEAQLDGAATKVAMMGYSGGAIATGWAAQLQPDYAPEINLVGVASGGTPADLEAAESTMDGTLDGGGLFVGAAFAVMREYPELLTVINAKGLAYADKIKDQCLYQLVSHAYDSVKKYSDSPDPMREPVAQAVLNELKMGGDLAPTVPYYLWHSTRDQLIPYRVAPALRDDWCSQGTQVTLVTDRLSEHLIGGVKYAAPAQRWLMDRYAGKPVTGAC
ncbi:MAG: lipase family protein [Aeromicrobium sp.]